MDLISNRNRQDELDDTEIHIAEFVKARAQEMSAMAQMASQIQGNSRIQQQVPRHVRRRAASYNIKRLPRRLREKALEEHAKFPPKVKKRPSRKHRRRPSNLLQEYCRRQRKHAWLETHIWHAKRFHMSELWGFKLPNFPNDKSLRASYKASVEHCLIWDMSYMVCLQLSGPRETVTQKLNQLCSSDCGKIFSSMAVQSGSVEGHTILYHANSYPYNAIGPVTFMWKPVSDEHPALWLWVHPSIYKETLTELFTLFCVNSDISSFTEAQSYSQTIVKERFPPLPVPCCRGDGVEIRSLKQKLCRFRLTGATSHRVLLQVIHKTQVTLQTGDQLPDCFWWRDFFGNDSAMHVFDLQYQVLDAVEKLSSAAYLPPHTIVGLTVRDPRVFIPQTKMFLQPSQIQEETCTETGAPVNGREELQHWPLVSSSPLWEQSVREQVLASKMSDLEMNKKRNQQSVPGKVLSLDDQEARVPVLLIHQPGVPEVSVSSNPTPVIPYYGGGWDIVLPQGWAMAFWVALVYNGARAGGQRELSNLLYEVGQLDYPINTPDTKAGWDMAEQQKKTLQEIYHKKPPSKRVNYAKFKVDHPFECNWIELSKCWQLETTARYDSLNRVYVLRNQEVLFKLATLCSNSDYSCLEPHCRVVSSLMNSPDRGSCLVPVSLTMLKRGTCSQFAHISIPIDTDLLALDQSTDCSEIALNSSIQRQVIGYVTNGGFSLRRGCGFGVGYVVLSGLVQLHTSIQWAQQTLVLIRSTNSELHRFAKINVLH